MTPKEKARELTNKFAKVEPYLPTKETILFMYEAKQCAIICVDEILNDNLNPLVYESESDFYLYWENVKTEISLM